MKSKPLSRTLLTSAALLTLGAAPVHAATINWTDWTSVSAAASQVFGMLTVGSSTVNVTYSGAYYFAQTSGGTNYWDPDAPYLSTTVENAPPAYDIIALSTGGSKTITFSQAVVDPLIALVSWNGNTVDFGVPIEILSYDTGYWGNGTPNLNNSGTGFYGDGEVHGVIKLPGTFTSITFNDTPELWHGFTVGVIGLGSSNGVPEPASLTLLGMGLAGLAGLRRRKA